MSARMTAVDRALGRIPCPLPKREAERARRRVPEAIELARHSLRMAEIALGGPDGGDSALAHLVCAQGHITRALGKYDPGAKR